MGMLTDATSVAFAGTICRLAISVDFPSESIQVSRTGTSMPAIPCVDN